MKGTRYLWLVVPALGLLELALHVFFAHRAPTKVEWAELKPLVASLYRQSDVVIVAPYWAEPMARWNFGDTLMPPRDVARGDATRYPQAIEVSIFGSHSPELAGWKVLRETKQGKFTVRTVANPTPPTVTYDFVDHLDPGAVDVRIERAGEVTSCPYTTTATVEGGGLGQPPIFPASRFSCPGQPPHVFVGVTMIDDQDMHPRRCIWSHPPGGDAEVVTHFRGVPLGGTIHGHAGMSWHFERSLNVPAFKIRVTAGGSEVGTFVHQAGDFWKGFDVPLGAAAHTTNDVEFRVSAASGVHVCFEADSR